jgi:hypothetical protein
VLARADVSDDA